MQLFPGKYSCLFFRCRKYFIYFIFYVGNIIYVYKYQAKSKEKWEWKKQTHNEMSFHTYRVNKSVTSTISRMRRREDLGPWWWNAEQYVQFGMQFDISLKANQMVIYLVTPKKMENMYKNVLNYLLYTKAENNSQYIPIGDGTHWWNSRAPWLWNAASWGLTLPTSSRDADAG